MLADRMGCLKGGVVANKVVPTGEYVRFAAHHGFRPDFCEAADPESKGIVENLVGYAKTDLMIPGAGGSGDPFTDLGAANAAAAVWCVEVNAAVHAEICAVPAERLVIERELLAAVAVAAGQHRPVGDPQGRPAVLCPVRLGALLGAGPADRRPGAAARRPRPVAGDPRRPGDAARVVAEHLLVAPGEASILDEHYGGPRPAPRRAVRPKTAAEKAFCALGPTAEAFITGAAAAGNTRLGPELAELNTLAAAHGERGASSTPWPGRSRSAAGGPPTCAPSSPPAPEHPSPPPAGDALVLELPRVPTRPLSDYAIGATPTGGPRSGARRERGRAGAGARSRRRAAPAQAGRDAPTRPGTAAHREDPAVGTRGAAAHPDRGRDHRPGRLQRPHPAQDRRVPGRQDPRRVRPHRVHDQPARPSTTSPPWNGSPPGRTSAWSDRPAPARATCSSRSASPPCNAGHRVRYFTAADLVETLYRGLADNSVGRVIDTLLRHDLIICDEVGFAPLDDTGAQLLFRFIAAAYERRALGIASHWPFEAWGRFLPEHTTAVSLLDRLLHHANVVVTDGESYRMREARTRQPGGATSS